MRVLSPRLLRGREVVPIPRRVPHVQRRMPPPRHLCGTDRPGQVLLSTWLWRTRGWSSRLFTWTGTCTSWACSSRRSKWRPCGSVLFFSMSERSHLQTDCSFLLLSMRTWFPGTSLRPKRGPLSHKALPQWSDLYQHRARPGVRMRPRVHRRGLRAGGAGLRRAVRWACGLHRLPRWLWNVLRPLHLV